MTEESATEKSATEGTVAGPGAADEAAGTAGAAYADCVLCRKPTEHLATVRGATLCPVCAWQEAQRTACSG
ncbi:MULTISPECIES: hypothetical protein [unclassified Streptomyces]|uniref:hypothetical protein n=1 Tax=unclassified Streptomyces TaxID=2593676 RepID=UPI002E28A873|nr:hypothetical protein [Streptomyces sp. NBC_01429]